VFANLTYLDTLNRYIVLCSYKALLGISERSLVSTEPTIFVFPSFQVKNDSAISVNPYIRL
ncbi:MAG: hypothetical protein WBE34_09480, partial [Candidatus Nitrosopolaris sp.]